MTSPKPATEYTAITTIVVLASLRQQAEAAAVAADPEGGAGTFVPGVPLRAAGDASNTVVAYWTRWNMKPGQRQAFAQTMGGPMQIINAGGSVNLGRDRWMFENAADAWPPALVLSTLGFATLAPPSY